MLLNDEYIAIFLQKFVDIELGLLEIFENVAGVWFLCCLLYTSDAADE